jgi:putative hemolysin
LDDPLSILGAAVIAIGIGAIFLFSLAEASLLAISHIAVRRLVEREDRRALVLQRLKSNDDYLSTIIVGLNASVILVSTVMTLLVKSRLHEGGGWQAELWHIGTLVVILVLAELTPKTLGALVPEKWALVLAGPIERFSVVAAPIILAVTAIGNLLLRARGAEARHRRHFVTASEIQAAADVGEEEGVLEPEEGEMLDSVIELADTTAREIMVPRVDIVAVPSDVTVEECVKVAVESGYSRIPVYRDTRDSIIGILYLTDLLKEFRDGRRDVDIAALAREPVFVPETKRVGELFAELRDQTVHIAVVLDEFGGTEGLVTIEDILEELVGDIEDEHDAPGEEIRVVSETEALIDGKTRIADVNEELSVELPEDDYGTIGGLIAGELGHIPQAGERLEAGDVELVVEEGNEQYVGLVRLVKADREGGDA